MDKNLKNLRKQIDEIDQEMMNLFIKRMDIVSYIAQTKAINKIDTIDLNREKEILEKINNNSNNLIKSYYSKVQKVLFEISKEYQKTLKF